MTSKNSCFDRAIFRRSLRRTAPIWGLFCLYELLLPLRLYSYCRGVSVCTEDFFVQAERTILENAVTGASVVPFVYGGLLAWALFSWLFRTNSAYFYAALPVRRQTADAVSDQLPDGAAAVRRAGAGVVAAVMGGRRRLRRVGLFARDAGVRGDGDGFFAVFLVCVAGVHGRRADGGCAARLRDAEFCRLRARVDRAASDADLCLRHARESDDRGRTRRGLRLAGLRPAARRLPRGDRMGRRGCGGL